jgi:hypothetical protein
MAERNRVLLTGENPHLEGCTHPRIARGGHILGRAALEFGMKAPNSSAVHGPAS